VFVEMNIQEGERYKERAAISQNEYEKSKGGEIPGVNIPYPRPSGA
jgi:hypothetical protein